MNQEQTTEQKETEFISDEKAIVAWNNVISVLLKMPGAVVNREDFLRKELSKHYDKSIVDDVIANGYKESPVNKDDLDKIAKSVIRNHTFWTTGTSFLTGIPGGLAMLGTIPADITQFYWHVIVVAQELAYLYGWSDFKKKVDSDKSFSTILNVFIGVMTGIKGAIKVLNKLTVAFSQQVAKRLPQIALTKYGIYNVSKQIAKWLGVTVTKQTFSKSVSKFIPILGGIVSGSITVGTFLPMANRLKKYLSDNFLSQVQKYENDEIIVEDEKE